MEEEGGPGHQPYKDKSPEEQQWNRVVVPGHSQIEVPQQVLIDEIEPGPAMDVSVRWLRYDPMTMGKGDASRLTLCRVCEANKKVPRCGNDKKNQDAAKGMQLAKPGDTPANSTGEKQVQENNSNRKNNSDKALGKNIERAAGGEPIAEQTVWLRLLLGKPIAEDCNRKPEADHYVGDRDASEDKDSEA